MNHDLLIGINVLKYSVIDFTTNRIRFHTKVADSDNSTCELRLQLEGNVIDGDTALVAVPVSEESDRLQAKDKFTTPEVNRVQTDGGEPAQFSVHLSKM